MPNPHLLPPGATAQEEPMSEQPNSPPAAPPASAPPSGSTAPAGGAPAAPSAWDGPWYESPALSLDNDIRELYKTRNTQSLGDALRNGAHAFKALQDRNAISLPAADKIGEWDGWSKLGWTEKGEDYKLARPEAFKDHPDYDPSFEGAFREAAHKARVPVSQAQAVFDQVSGFLKQALDRDTAARQETTAAELAAVRQEWGAEYDSRLERSRVAARAFGLPAADLAVIETALGSSGAVMRLFDAIGSKMGEDKLVMGDTPASTVPGSATAVEAELNRLKADPAWVKSITDPRHPQHKANSERRAQLLARKASFITA
jgi:hypothetical protein